MYGEAQNVGLNFYEVAISQFMRFELMKIRLEVISVGGSQKQNVRFRRPFFVSRVVKILTGFQIFVLILTALSSLYSVLFKFRNRFMDLIFTKTLSCLTHPSKSLEEFSHLFKKFLKVFSTLAKPLQLALCVISANINIT